MPEQSPDKLDTGATEKARPRQSALLIILNSDNKVLLQHKSAGAPNWPNTWCLFGGGVEPGEEPGAAVEREMSEELGLQVADYEEFTTETSGGIERHVFTARTDESAEALRAKQMEGDDLAFFGKDELGDIDAAPPHIALVNKYFEQAGQ